MAVKSLLISSPALFVDRDGVINRMVRRSRLNYDAPQFPRDVSLVEGIAEVIRQAKILGYKIIVVTNRPEVAKEKLTRLQSQRVESRIRQLLTLENADWDGYFACPHHPQALSQMYRLECDCRKPKPGLIHQAQKQYDLDLKQSFILGDGAADVGAGNAAGIKTILYLHRENDPQKVEAAYACPSDWRVEDLSQVLEIIANSNQSA